MNEKKNSEKKNNGKEPNRFPGARPPGSLRAPRPQPGLSSDGLGGAPSGRTYQCRGSRDVRKKCGFPLTLALLKDF